MPGKRNRRKKSKLLVELWHLYRPILRGVLLHSAIVISWVLSLGFSNWLATMFLDGLERPIFLAFHLISSLRLLIRKTPDA